jgi:hypothetical protein
VAEFTKNVESAPKSSAIDLTVIADASKANELAGGPGSHPRITILSVEDGGGGMVLVRNMSDKSRGIDMFTEEYIVRHVCG